MSDSRSSDPRPNPVPFAGPADFAQALRRMQPRGRLWDGPDDSLMAQLRTAQTALLAQFSGRLAVLTETEAYPPTSIELLPVWEEAFGLPDPCTPLNPTIAERQQALGAKIAQNANLSRQTIINVAAALGYTVTITEYHAATADTLVADEPVYDPAWAFAWQVNAPEFTVEYLCADTGRADDPLASWGNTSLSCELQRLAPPGTYLIFSFGG
jgi:uncharacterized protein YmfQ (DUF2313 family)